MPTSQQRARILVVDDIADNHVLLCRGLRAAGYEAEACEDGVEAIARVSMDPPDIVILDWMMPGLSGIDVLKAIRERFDANVLPVIICTARSEADSIAAALDAGANDYLQKPICMQIAIARILSQLERRASLLNLSEVNRDLESALAQRTRALLGRQATAAVADGSDRSRDLEDILRMAQWLRTPEAADRELLAACADTLARAAQRLAAA